MTTATAHPNIALIKYWGKQDAPGNIPVAPNVSITLSNLTTTTAVCEHHQDEFWLNEERVVDTKLEGFLADLRREFSIAPVKIESTNNFPTGAGLASSASGFAALITALNHHAKLRLDIATMSQWARRGSASAARSLMCGYVSLTPPAWRAEQVAAPEHWPLHVVVAVTSTAPKSIGSTAGMRISRDTSPYFPAWVATGANDFDDAVQAIAQRDFDKLAATAELSCLKMHSVMLTSVPTLAYWNPATVACMDAVRSLRAAGTAVFFSIDAGPQVKAICLPQHTDTVEQALRQIEGVTQTIRCALGDAAQVIRP
jgi:diphosphomevalonate decarboxylase